MDAADDAIALQLLQPGRDVGAGEAEVVNDLLGMERVIGEIEQSVDLCDRAVDAPMRAHFSPMKDEGLGRGMIEQGHE